MSTLISFVAQLYLVSAASRDVLVANNIYTTYSASIQKEAGEADTKRIEAYFNIFSNSGFAFPPKNWITLEIMKLLGGLGGLVITYVTLETLFFVKVEILLEPPKRREEDIDTEVKINFDRRL